MAVQSGDVFYAERSGISGTTTGQDIKDFIYTVMTQAAYDALSQAEKDSSGFVIIVG